MSGGTGAIVIRGDARNLPLPDASVDLIVTSPPYYALRSYTDGGEHYEGQIGSEPSPGEYIDNLVACTAEWMRVLKPSGSCFVDFGDKYAGSNGQAGGGGKSTLSGAANARPRDAQQMPQRRGYVPQCDIPAKSLMLLPERYRIACVDRLGLIARAVIIHDKPHGLAESVTDRVRRSHEDWVHLVKAPRYYSAVDEIRELHTGGTHARRADGQMSPKERATVEAGHRRGYFPEHSFNPLGKLPGSVWTVPTEPLSVPPELGVDHFAAFPSEWPRRLILGWSPPGICLVCGEGRHPAADVSYTPAGGASGNEKYGRRGMPAHVMDQGTRKPQEMKHGRANASRSITGYVCACTPYTDHPGTAPTWKPWREYHLDGWTPPPTRPAVVLDPFGGTGTTALVASVLGRIGVSVDRSGDYCRLAGWRITDPGERAKAMRVAKPAPVAETQMVLEWEVWWRVE